MGVLADGFKARLDEMRTRHAETDRQLLEARNRVYESLAEMRRIIDERQEEEA